MEIIGEISNIIYKNEINSYTIAELETEEKNNISSRKIALKKLEQDIR